MNVTNLNAILRLSAGAAAIATGIGLTAYGLVSNQPDVSKGGGALITLGAAIFWDTRIQP